MTRAPHRAGRRGLVAALLVLALLLAACASDEGGSADGGSTDDAGRDDGADEEAQPLHADFDPEQVAEATVEPPPVEGRGAVILAGGGALDLAASGYEEEELFVSGTATSYRSAEPLAEDGAWMVAPDEEAPYTTRVVVRRPTDPEAFNGTVVVEWFNVSGGLDAAPDWTYLHTELIRSGYAWVGVTAQEAGIEGGGGLAATLKLKNADPDRYGPIDHPGDAYSYDMFSQVGAALRTQPEAVLGGLEPEQVLAVGESQSAFRLTTYANAVAPLANVYDGILIHSRTDGAAALNAEQEPPTPTYVRTDLDVPVLIFSSETDLVGLEYARARQDDTDLIRGWEVPGTAHADAYNLGIGDTDDGSGAADVALFEAMLDPPSTIYRGVIECDRPINAGPHTYVLRAALDALDRWSATGQPPQEMPRIELDDDLMPVLDDHGNALGGIRTPQVDVPVAVLSGQGQTGTSFCGLFGITDPFDADALAQVAPDRAAFLEGWQGALAEAVAAGAILDADVEPLQAAADEAAPTF